MWLSDNPKESNPGEKASHSQTVLITLHHADLLSSTFSIHGKMLKVFGYIKTFPNFVSHYIVLRGFQRDVLTAQACFDVTALHRVGEWHAESKLLKWEPHWEHVNLMLYFHTHWAQFPSFASDMRGVRDQKLLCDKTGTQTVGGRSLVVFLVQSGSHVGHVLASPVADKAPAGLVRLGCVWVLWNWLVVL